MNIFEEWSITTEDISELVGANPNLRGYLFGYIAEKKLKQFYFPEAVKISDQSRESVYDYDVLVGQEEVRLEVKSLTQPGDQVKCMHSRSRDLILPTGKTIRTDAVYIKDFDLLAINLFPSQKIWEFAFARSDYLPRTTVSRYAAEDREFLVAGYFSWRGVVPPYFLSPLEAWRYGREGNTQFLRDKQLGFW